MDEASSIAVQIIERFKHPVAMSSHLMTPFAFIEPTSWLSSYGEIMNKGELVDAIAEKANVAKKEADAVLSAAIETIVETVASGEKITVVGFGSFEKRDRQAREGRNPRTGETMTIAATSVPAFSAGKLFKEKVAGA
jgi:DNA-binding protein HU-beta